MKNIIKINSLYVTDKEVIAQVRVNFFETKIINVKSIELALLLNDQSEWNKIKNLSSEEIKDYLNHTTESMRKNQQNKLIDLLLKISGEHSDKSEVRETRILLNNFFEIDDNNFNVMTESITKEDVIKSQTRKIDVKEIEQNELSNVSDVKIGSPLWIGVGFVLSFLGGLIGLWIGTNYAFGNYDRQTKLLGYVMMFISLIVMAVIKQNF